MIRHVHVDNFKRFASLEVELGALTVLTGLNGSGKSSVLQALSLAHRASGSGRSTVGLVDDEGFDLGKAEDVLNVEAQSSQVGVAVTDDSGAEYAWSFDFGGVEDGSAPYLRVLSQPETVPFPFGSVDGDFLALGAERIGPRTSHPTTASGPDYVGVGSDGRYVAHALATHGRHEVHERLRHKSAGDVVTLNAQTEAWLSELVGKTQLEAALVPGTSLATIRMRSAGRLGEWMLPTNTGFGVSYVLPVIVAALLARPGSILIVDSPEAHMHPAAQSALGAMLARVAAAGVQVFVETHSDHVINGLRRAIAVEQVLAPEAAVFYFFGQEVAPQRITLSKRGKFDTWPQGFFDQMDHDLSAITRIGRSV